MFLMQLLCSHTLFVDDVVVFTEPIYQDIRSAFCFTEINGACNLANEADLDADMTRVSNLGWVASSKASILIQVAM